MEISKTEYAVFVIYKLESKYKKYSKFEEVMVQNQKKLSYLKWNATVCLFRLFFVCFAYFVFLISSSKKLREQNSNIKPKKLNILKTEYEMTLT
jgi:hypothetical protein